MAERDTSSAHSNLRFPAWQPQFEAVLFEADPLKWPERVQAAETFIFLRLKELMFRRE